MQETYALHEGAFGRAVVLELRGDLIAHAHAEVQLALWLGGSRAEARVGSKLVRYSEHLALGTNTYESHDARLLDRSGPAVFLVLYIARPWLDERRAATGRSYTSVAGRDSACSTAKRTLFQSGIPYQKTIHVSSFTAPSAFAK